MAKSASIEPGIARVHRGRQVFYRVQISGAKVGKRRLSKVCATYDEARAVKARWLMTGGATLEAPADEDDTGAATLEDALRAYLDDLRSRRKDPRRAAQILGALRAAALATRPIGRLTVGDLFAFRHAREDAGIKPNTIIRDLRVLRAVLKATRPGLRFPVDLWPAENLTRVRVLRPADEARIFPRLGEPVRTMARLAALTLMRLSDIRTLTRDMVHLEQHLLLLPKTKTIPRPVILGDEATALLAAVIAGLPAEARYLWTSPRTSRPYTRWYISAAWRRAADAAGLRGFTFHDLKHHGATVALNAGASDALLMQLGGWTRPDQVRRYASAVSGRLREMANLIAEGLRHDV